jgi:hypothetical protein
MADRAKPRTVYVAFTDMMAAAGIILPGAFLLFAVVIGVVAGIEESYGFLGMAAVAALIGFPVAWWRVRRIQETVANGVEVNGKVTWVKLGRRTSGNTQVKWEYQYGGKLYQGDAYVSQNGEVRIPAKGERIRLVVNPDKPEWSVWKDLYSTSLALGNH